jgi:LysR family transcriptional regulator, glycine cleavage system transcriptional activator
MKSAHPKRNGLPSLARLQAFEAAARHLSFTLAAEELSITPTAISHRIRELESELGLRLFRRGHRSVMLTQEGERVARDVAESFDCLRASMAKLRGTCDESLTIAVDEAFAMFWLTPRLAAFRERNPEITIRLDPLSGAPNFEVDGQDAAIVFGRQEPCDGASDCLFQTRLVPVRAPSLAAPCATMEGLPLLELSAQDPAFNMPGWDEWLKAAQLRSPIQPVRIALGSMALAIEAARSGLGAALAPAHLVAADLSSGRLVSPHPLFLPVPQAHSLVYPQEYRARPSLRTFRSWLLSEVQRERARPHPT